MLQASGSGGKFALLPTVGGQTALNLAVELADADVLDRYGVALIGAQLRAIKLAEDRLLFKDAMTRIGLDVPRSALVNNLKDAMDFAGKIGFPVIVRPSFTLGGTGGGIAYNREELLEIVARGLDHSPVHEVLIEESVLGWKEYELEVMRDLADNVIIICSIENFDPMGVHTGDSITVAPAQTLTDREYQHMRDAAIKVIREIGVETGGSDIQFAVDPSRARMVVIEMNPRGLRSTALASKATRVSLVTPHPERLTYIRYALHQGMTVKELHKMTSIDPWFLYQLKEITATETEVAKHTAESLPRELLREAKRAGASDERLALSLKTSAQAISRLRQQHGIRPVNKLVDTCAAEFESYTPYPYSTYQQEHKVA